MMKMLTQAEAMKILKVGPITLGRWEKSGEIPVTVVDGVKTYAADAVGHASLLLELRRPGQWTQTKRVNNRIQAKRRRIKKRQERIQNSIKKYAYGQEVNSDNIHTENEYKDLIRMQARRKALHSVGPEAITDTTTQVS